MQNASNMLRDVFNFNFLWLLRDISTMQITTFFSFYKKKNLKNQTKEEKNQEPKEKFKMSIE